MLDKRNATVIVDFIPFFFLVFIKKTYFKLFIKDLAQRVWSFFDYFYLYRFGVIKDKIYKRSGIIRIKYIERTIQISFDPIKKCIKLITLNV